MVKGVGTGHWLPPGHSGGEEENHEEFPGSTPFLGLSTIILWSGD